MSIIGGKDEKWYNESGKHEIFPLMYLDYVH